MTVFASPTLSSDYQSLCNAIADILNRQDLLTGIPNFVALATARISRDVARIKHPTAIVRAQASVTDNYASLPVDFVAMYQLMDQDTSITLEYVTPDQIKQVMANGWPTSVAPYPPSPYQAPSSAGPIYFSILGNTLRIIPAPGASAPTTLDLWYYAKLTELSATSTTNWVLTRYPDLYLYGALAHSAPYLKADERLAVWEGIYQKLLSDIEIEADRAVRPQSKLVAARKSFG
jgi:hypothetical protein